MAGAFWHPESYNDYALLAAKLAPAATKLDVSSAARWDEDWDVIKSKCPSIEIVTEESSAVQPICTGNPVPTAQPHLEVMCAELLI